MTRINVVPVEELHTRHLVAEYKEFTQFLHIVAKRSKFDDLPKEYTLNKGHCKFFFDKGRFMEDRFNRIAEELINRGISIDLEKFNDRADRITESYTIFRDYTPTEEALAINRERIAQRIAEKPHLYGEG